MDKRIKILRKIKNETSYCIKHNLLDGTKKLELLENRLFDLDNDLYYKVILKHEELTKVRCSRIIKMIKELGG